MLRALRDKHIQMVSRYIIVKSRESRSMSRTRRESSPEPVQRGGAGIAGIRYGRPDETRHGPEKEENAWDRRHGSDPLPEAG